MRPSTTLSLARCLLRRMLGFRDAEGRFTTWRDVDFKHMAVRVTAKRHWGFHPKNWEEREVPVPQKFLEHPLLLLLVFQLPLQRCTALLLILSLAVPHSCRIVLVCLADIVLEVVKYKLGVLVVPLPANSTLLGSFPCTNDNLVGMNSGASRSARCAAGRRGRGTLRARGGRWWRGD